MLHLQHSNVNSQQRGYFAPVRPSHLLLTKRKLPVRPRENFMGKATLCRAASKRDVCSYKNRSMIGPSFLIVVAGHSFRSVMIALSRA